MNPKIEKLEKEIEKTKTKIAEMQAKLHKLEEQKTELENTDYVSCVDKKDTFAKHCATRLCGISMKIFQKSKSDFRTPDQ